MDALMRLYFDARDRTELKPESAAEQAIVDQFNATLNQLKHRFPRDRFIQSIPCVGGAIINRHIYLRVRNLQGAILMAQPEHAL
jgi:hypothetical protein